MSNYKTDLDRGVGGFVGALRFELVVYSKLENWRQKDDAIKWTWSEIATKMQASG